MPLRQVLARMSYAVRRFLTGWRRSIQARVVVSTMAMSTVVVGAVGVYVLDSTRDGIVEQRVQLVVAEAETETIEARRRLSSSSDLLRDEQLRVLVDPIIERGAARGFGVVLSPSIQSGERLEAGSARTTRNLDLATIPQEFRSLYAQPRGTGWSYTDVRTRGPVTGLRPGPGVVVATLVTLPADGQTYVLYHVSTLR